MYSKFILQIFLLSQLADLQCGMATIRKLQFRFACDSEHFRPFGFKFFIFRHIFLAILYFFIGFILRQAYTAREAEDLGKASLCRIGLPLANQWQHNTRRRRTFGESLPLPYMPAARKPMATQYPPQTAITRKIRAKASYR